ncbi:2-amino-4-hydroxy-6-hydroxymethyldihydropteridine pyrophosphokinase [Ruegeria marisrubri]|uniref:2-amino-4-hydroxy-6-hydroxymethyldihydropteridine pyrophosphokinase n=1 Tax=Ruegeria marisrubri TaxID=1685379 RepID=A0A0X3UE84_9RHOB|nr:2-amino-4-hydroxy-6-hydroxymethyldihydropteridine diphosphokinase [Ruegeria marisrubri]KUJ85086.1 2-amino-4-hydroxy-6-hydroxymethyldihydropteridine pyrophosphokinase [Ruegeria marisrubri]
MTKRRSKIVLALGGNLDLRQSGPEVTLRQALIALEQEGLVIRQVSRFFATPCFPAGAGPDYVNAAALVESDMTPHTLLDLLHRVEHQFGRARVQRWGMRTLDLDVICWEDLVLPDRQEYDRWRTLPQAEQIRATPNQLILPHPRLQDRAFVLVPMADIAPEWRHPVLGRTVSELLEDLPAEDVAAVTPL